MSGEPAGTAPHRDARPLRCPVCRARQAWSVACRRCDADLSLLLAVARRARDARAQAIEALREGRAEAALALAQAAHELRPGPGSRRLLAACRLGGAVGAREP